MKPSTETPVSFLDSLPPHARRWCWLPWQSVSLTGPLPHGMRTEFSVKREPWRRIHAHNVGQVSTKAQP